MGSGINTESSGYTETTGSGYCLDELTSETSQVLLGVLLVQGHGFELAQSSTAVLSVVPRTLLALDALALNQGMQRTADDDASGFVQAAAAASGRALQAGSD